MTYLYSVQVRTADAWLTVGGDDADQVYQHLCEAVGETRGAQIWAAFAAEKTIRENLPVQQEEAAPARPAPSRPAGGPPAGPPRGPSRPAASQQQEEEAPYCHHNLPRNLRSGENARGPWSAWMCGAPKGTPRNQQCKPVDAVTGEEWG